MRLWVFSDLHLSDPHSPFYQSFLKILDEPQSDQDTVVFAGDIFEVLVGKSPYFSKKHHAFFRQVKNLAARHVNLFYIEGNHDFHIRPQFGNIPITFENESVQLKFQTAQGIKKIYIAHGDLVDQSDVGYLRLRSLFRSSLVQTLADAISGKWIEKLGEKIARPHDQKTSDLPEDWPASQRDRLRSVFRKFAIQKKNEGFDYIILGHCHDFDEIQPFYFNMGFPPVHGHFLFFDSMDDCVKRKSLRK